MFQLRPKNPRLFSIPAEEFLPQTIPVPVYFEKGKRVAEFETRKRFEERVDARRTFTVDGVDYKVKMYSQRFDCFRQSLVCACCGLKGKIFILEGIPGHEPPKGQGQSHTSIHFNLYGEIENAYVLFTKDHIVPVSRGGTDVLSNYQTMCFVCNLVKGGAHLENVELKENPIIQEWMRVVAENKPVALELGDAYVLKHKRFQHDIV